jgi:hypothetical protein
MQSGQVSGSCLTCLPLPLLLELRQLDQQSLHHLTRRHLRHVFLLSFCPYFKNIYAARASGNVCSSSRSITDVTLSDVPNTDNVIHVVQLCVTSEHVPPKLSVSIVVATRQHLFAHRAQHERVLKLCHVTACVQCAITNTLLMK